MSTLQEQIDQIRAALDLNSDAQAQPLAIVRDRTARKNAITSAIAEAAAAVAAARVPLGDALVAEADGGPPDDVLAIRVSIATAETALDAANARLPEIEELDAVTAVLNQRVAQLAAEVAPLHEQLEHLRTDQVRELLAERLGI